MIAYMVPETHGSLHPLNNANISLFGRSTEAATTVKNTVKSIIIIL